MTSKSKLRCQSHRVHHNLSPTSPNLYRSNCWNLNEIVAGLADSKRTRVNAGRRSTINRVLEHGISYTHHHTVGHPVDEDGANHCKVRDKAKRAPTSKNHLRQLRQQNTVELIAKSESREDPRIRHFQARKSLDCSTRRRSHGLSTISQKSTEDGATLHLRAIGDAHHGTNSTVNVCHRIRLNCLKNSLEFRATSIIHPSRLQHNLCCS